MTGVVYDEQRLFIIFVADESGKMLVDLQLCVLPSVELCLCDLESISFAEHIAETIDLHNFSNKTNSVFPIRDRLLVGRRRSQCPASPNES